MWSCFGSSSQTYLQKKIVAANSEKHFNRLEKAIKHRDLTDETIAVYVNKCVAKWNETESLCPSQARILEYIRQKQGTHLFRSIVAALEQFNGGAMRELLHTYIIWADILLEDDFERFCQRCRSFTLFIRQEQWAPSLVLQALIKTCESLAQIKNEAKWNVCEVLLQIPPDDCLVSLPLNSGHAFGLAQQLLNEVLLETDQHQGELLVQLLSILLSKLDPTLYQLSVDSIGNVRSRLQLMREHCLQRRCTSNSGLVGAAVQEIALRLNIGLKTDGE
jgi:hypothetical protein